eukprot:TRINITY_DN24436_c0_g1_i1.p1 TRINITY_DN24436_c0_g1~~TRINITY_DN24436_c0_g1_i1.p1  ORF type:complete len:131 (-),score=5.82 TRINITY_DN24436_c0_g1_i1:198-590(-)
MRASYNMHKYDEWDDLIQKVSSFDLYSVAMTAEIIKEIEGKMLAFNDEWNEAYKSFMFLPSRRVCDGMIKFLQYAMVASILSNINKDPLSECDMYGKYKLDANIIPFISFTSLHLITTIIKGFEASIEST